MTPEELKVHCQEAQKRVKHLHAFLGIDPKRAEREKIEQLMSAPDFWNSREKAREVITRLSACKNTIEPFQKLHHETEDFAAMVDLALESGDAEMLNETAEAWKKLALALEKIEILSYLAGKFDGNNAYFSLHAGAGGTESCDWASMLLRMYRRWFERRGYEDSIIDYQPGEEAGIKNATLLVKGDFAYGYLRAEQGIHRLVRISPFDSNSRRHTSFASVDVFPELNEEIEVDVEEKDLKVDTYRSSGAGGQHVNTTDSAIRITHLPTGITVSCQAERSQHKNRAMAMKMLQARLYELQEEQNKKEADEIRGEKTDMGWGNQIRSYVLQPYQMVKDLRTGMESGNTAAVLDGDLDQFVETWLKSH
jgi:peptide chain release factor 2